MEIASAIGTAFHDCVEQYLDNGEWIIRMDKYSSCKPRVCGMMKSWTAWAESVDGIIEYTELKVINKLHRYSGTLDAIGVFGKKRKIVDWKTGARIYPDMAFQLSGYAEGYNEQTSSKVKDGLIVHISKDKPDFKVTTKEFKLGKRVFNKFLKLRAMFDEIQGNSRVVGL